MTWLQSSELGPLQEKTVTENGVLRPFRKRREIWKWDRRPSRSGIKCSLTVRHGLLGNVYHFVSIFIFLNHCGDRYIHPDTIYVNTNNPFQLRVPREKQMLDDKHKTKQSPTSFLSEPLLRSLRWKRKGTTPSTLHIVRLSGQPFTKGSLVGPRVLRM